MATETSLLSSLSTTNNIELTEQIEWDLPYNTDGEFPDFSNLSLSTEMRNKLWESDNKMMTLGMGSIHSSNGTPSSPSLDQNQNLSLDAMQFLNGVHLSVANNMKVSQHHQGISTLAGNEIYSNGKCTKTSSVNHNSAGTGVSTNNLQSSLKAHPCSQPLLQSPIPMPNERKTPELLSTQENGYSLDPRRLNESQTIKEELLEMKSIFTRLAANTEDISGLPEPVQLALKVIELEGSIQDSDIRLHSQDMNLSKQNNEIEKMKKDYTFELAMLKKEIKFLKEKLDYKATLEASTKGRMKAKDEKAGIENDAEIEKLNEEVKSLKEENEKNSQEYEAFKNEADHKLKMVQFDTANYEKEVSSLTDKLMQEQTKGQNRKTEIERYIVAAREAMERERQDRYILLVEQNKLKHKVEKLSESCKSYQMKNEELCRIQNELEQECDQFRKLKKIIQDHGLPNHEQLVMLQQQTEMFKDDVLSERKDRERAQAQRDKLRRDLEILQSRNQSLQEQVYKYQEHIMRLNTGDRRAPPPQEFIPQQHQGNSNRFSRQLSNPAYFNPRIRLSPTNIVGPLMKNHQVSAPVSPGVTSCNSPPISDSSRMSNGFPMNMNGRGGDHGMRSPQGFGNSSNFDPWLQQQRNGYQQHQQQQQQPPQQQQHLQQRNSNFNMAGANSSQMPQSPLLGPNGDPWVLPPSPNSASQQQPQQQQQQINSGMSGGYSTNIWSQASPASPNAFSGTSSGSMHNPSPGSPSWQLSDPPAGFVNTSSGESTGILKAVPEGELMWSTATDDVTASSSEQQSNATLQYHNNNNDMLETCNTEQDTVISRNLPQDSVAFQCRKCSMKLPNVESFRGHAEKCFN